MSTTASRDGKGRHHDHQYEFGGPLGATAVVICLPLVIFALFFLCNADTCLTFDNSFSAFDWTLFMHQLLSIHTRLTPLGLQIYLAWFLFQVLLERCLPGEVVHGVVLPGTKATRLPYTMNGHLAFWISIILMGHAIPLVIETSPQVYALVGFRPLPLALLYDHYVELIAASVTFSAILSVYLYLSSFRPSSSTIILAKGGNTGCTIYDFFIGRELNPRIDFSFFFPFLKNSIALDLKCFCELRPGLIGWVVLDLAMAFAQYKYVHIAFMVRGMKYYV